MAGVRNKTAHLLLTRLTSDESRLNVADHGVDGAHHPADLGVLANTGNHHSLKLVNLTSTELAIRNVVCRERNLFKRSHGSPNHKGSHHS